MIRMEMPVTSYPAGVNTLSMRTFSRVSVSNLLSINKPSDISIGLSIAVGSAERIVRDLPDTFSRSIKSRVRQFTCDRMTISIHVIADEPTHDRAVQKCMNDSEALLKDLQSSGLELNQIKLNNHSVSTRHYDNKPYIHAERGIEIEAAFDMRLINHLTDLIQTSHYNADISTGFSVSDLAGIHRQLIEEAFKDSRKKAEIIAALMGQKIAGIEKVEVGDRYDDDYLSDYQIGESEFICREKAFISDRLSATDTEESETVTVIWILE